MRDPCGMSLRAWLAGQALPRVELRLTAVIDGEKVTVPMTRISQADCDRLWGWLSVQCVQIADAMLKELEK